MERRKIITGNWDGQEIWRWETMGEVLVRSMKDAALLRKKQNEKRNRMGKSVQLPNAN